MIEVGKCAQSAAGKAFQKRTDTLLCQRSSNSQGFNPVCFLNAVEK